MKKNLRTPTHTKSKRNLDSYSAVGFFLPPKEVFFSFEEASQFYGIGAIGKCHVDGEARFHRCMVLTNSSRDIVHGFFKSFFFNIFHILFPHQISPLISNRRLSPRGLDSFSGEAFFQPSKIEGLFLF